MCNSLPEDAPVQVHEFVDYIADTYVGPEVYERAENQNDLVLRLRRAPRWKEPKFSPTMWSVYERVLNDEPRTTNMLERWHRRIGTVIARKTLSMILFNFDVTDKVSMYEEMMTNDDNVESSLLTSSLLKIHCLYKFCVELQVAHVKLEI